jgi:hypothetical protein
LVVYVAIKLLPFCLSQTHFPMSTQLIAYSNLFGYNFSDYLLQHSKYKTKYRFWMLIGTFLYYFYLLTYPYSNVTLTNSVFVTFSLYQIFHNLFKFSY